MLSGSLAVKSTAKVALKNNWTNVIIGSCIFMFSVLICNITASIINIALGQIGSFIILFAGTVFLSMPLFLGLLRYIWRILLGVCDNPVSVFYYFSQKCLYKKAMVLIFVLGIRALLWYAVLNIPSLVVKIVSSEAVYELLNVPMPIWTANLNNTVVFLNSLSGVLLCLIMLKFYLSPMLFIADDNIEVAEAIHMSTVISKKTAIDYIYLIFSFLGWIVISLFIIPLIFTLPYILTSYLVHSRFAVADYNNHIENSYKNDFSYDNVEF